MSDVEIDREGVKQALARLLAWPDIARSPQLANFLSYIVERRLNNDAQSIKAYSIAVDVFGRSADFDPQADPIVRVQARRLRGLLDQYYRGPGAAEPLRIQLPIGRYVPEFVGADQDPSMQPIGREPSVTVEAPPPVDRRGHVSLPWFVLLVLTLGATIASYSLATWERNREQQQVALGTVQRPLLRIMEFQNLTGDNSLTPTIAALAVELVTDFVPVLIVDAAYGGRGTVGVDTSRQDDYVLTGVVRNGAGGDGYEFSAILTDTETNDVVWNWSDTVARSDLLERDGIDYISRQLIARMGNPRGPLHAEARAFLAQTDIAGHENSYLCGILFAMYRASPTGGTLSRLQSCIGALPEALQANGNVLAARASLLAETMTAGQWNSDEQRARNAEAGELLAQALRATPTSSFAWEQQARFYETIGEHDDAQAAYSTALQLNSANIDGSAASARHLALMGKLAQAEPLAQWAIAAVSPLDVPGWFNCVPAMGALVDNTFLRAQRLAEQCGRADVELGAILGLLAADGANDVALLGKALPSILEVPTFRSSGIMVRLERRMTDPILLGQIDTALREAGVPERSLLGPY